MIQIKVAATCCVCGKTTDSAKNFEHLSLMSFNILSLESVQGQFLGKYICEAFGDCWKKIQK